MDSEEFGSGNVILFEVLAWLTPEESSSLMVSKQICSSIEIASKNGFLWQKRTNNLYNHGKDITSRKANWREMYFTIRRNIGYLNNALCKILIEPLKVDYLERIYQLRTVSLSLPNSDIIKIMLNDGLITGRMIEYCINSIDMRHVSINGGIDKLMEKCLLLLTDNRINVYSVLHKWFTNRSENDVRQLKRCIFDHGSIRTKLTSIECINLKCVL